MLVVEHGALSLPPNYEFYLLFGDIPCQRLRYRISMFVASRLLRVYISVWN